MKIKRVLFFSRGDSNNVSTWSNVPYLFCQTLEEKGIEVIRINYETCNKMCYAWNKTIFPILRLLYKNNQYEGIRTRWNNWLTWKKIQTSIVNNPDVDLCIFMGFSFYNKFNNIPSILFGDWTYELLIKDRLKRNPYFFEKKTIRQETEALTKADLVVTLFPKCKEFILENTPSCNIKWGKMNVINTLYKCDLNHKIIIKTKCESLKVLFIGRKQYIKGAELLIDSFDRLKKNKSKLKLELHIIGLEKKDFSFLSSNVYCHGFLRKDNKIERDLYYQLITTAKIFVNPTPEWGGYSSTIEAMYYYTPIIISPYRDFTEEFGHTINFGIYNKEFSIDSLTQNMTKILDLNAYDYEEMCVSAHNAVKNYTWDRYVDWILKECENLN